MSITLDHISENFCPTVIRLVFESMMDTNINSGSTHGLTLEEVKQILNRYKSVHRVLLNDDVIGVFNPGTVHPDLKKGWELDKRLTYGRIGFVYIDKKYRGNGYGVEVIKQHSDQFDNYAECCAEDNVSSNKMLAKHLTFNKRVYIPIRRAYYNIYSKEHGV